ncbi:hypothetical protein BN77_0778 [Rhizobium mesoamericanum STM3625]|uniref:Uncharacterized protein n=1 Tax=Rhizobium mesoamericanum STM3625 TaxID=1211777 RepID=K0PMU4_9HYPH|nr:hypothetical protein BN77_0778 [Rhizobium mesoamericanum STM3625]
MGADITSAAHDQNRFTCHAPPSILVSDVEDLEQVDGEEKNETKVARMSRVFCLSRH